MRYLILRISQSEKKKVAFLLLALAVIVGGVYWFIPDRTYHCLVPLKFNDFQVPLLDIEIENETYTVKFDLGSVYLLELDQDVLCHLQKQRYGTVTVFNYKGLCYQSPSYIIPAMKLGHMTFQQVPVNETCRQCEIDCQSRPSSSMKPATGYFGNFFLKKFKILCDFPHSLMFISNSNMQLHQEGYILEKMVKVPLQQEEGFLIIEVGTDAGKKRLIVDTGASSNVLKPVNSHEKKYVSSTFCLEDKDFGKTSFVVKNLAPQLGNIDGVLGMSFLQDHVIYIDCLNHILYLE